MQRTLEHRRGKNRIISRVRVSVLNGADAGQVSPSEPKLSLGTAADNQVVLKDPTVSRYHILLESTDRGIHLRDLGSRNGTFVADVRVREGFVPAGTTVQIGQTRIEVEADQADEDLGDAPEIPGLIGQSEPMQEVARLVARLAKADVTTVIQGETGTGKEVVAQAIHDLSRRADKPLVVVDCGSVPHTLIASELFGHERGAFTGASSRRIGAFEAADGGTIFLDEIGELPPQVQPALLGVLERRRFRRVGGHDDVSVDVRVLSATHRELREHVNQGKFRADLYYRLAVARIELPPLRERVEDIDELVAHFVERFTGIPDPDAFGPDVLSSLRAQRWGGNVRELRNVVESGLAFGAPRFDGPAAEAGDGEVLAGIAPYKEARTVALTAFETEFLKNLMAATEGNASKAAREAKMDRPYLLSLLRKHGLR